MKTAIKPVIALALTVAAAAANAGSFNDRGELFTDTVKPVATRTTNYRVQPGGFNDRGELFVIETSTGSQQTRVTKPVVLEGFNNRGYGQMVNVQYSNGSQPG